MAFPLGIPIGFLQIQSCSAGQIQLLSSSWLYQCKVAESIQGSKSISVSEHFRIWNVQDSTIIRFVTETTWARQWPQFLYG